MFKLTPLAVGALISLQQSFALAQTLCFASTTPSSVIRLQLTLPSEGSDLASLKYEKGSQAIPLLRTSESVARESASHGPATVKATFAELADGHRSGEYVLTTRGGAVGDLIYTRAKDKKRFAFYEDQEAAVGDRCEWPSTLKGAQ